MTMNRARYGLMGIFAASLVIQLTCFFVVRGRMWPEDFNGLILKLLEIYSAQLGLVLGGIFSQINNPRSDPPAAICWTAMTLVTLWNLLLVGRSMSFSVAQQDSATDLIKYFDTVGSGSAFLVAGAVAFFFGKGTEIAPANVRPGPSSK